MTFLLINMRATGVKTLKK